MANKGTAFSNELILELSKDCAQKIAIFTDELDEIGKELQGLANDEETNCEVFQPLVEFAEQEAPKFASVGGDSIAANLNGLQQKMLKTVHALDQTFSVDTVRKVKDLVANVSDAARKAYEESKQKNA